MAPLTAPARRGVLPLLLVLVLLIGLAGGPPAHVQSAQVPPPPALSPQDWSSIRGLLPLSQQAYLKGPQVSPQDNAGYRVAVAGETVVVGAPLEDSGTAGVQNTAAPSVDEAAANSGAAYVFVRSGTSWQLQAYLKASQVSPGDYFGSSVAIYGDTIVVGAFLEDSGTPGVQNTATPSVNEAVIQAGAAYVFVRSGAPGAAAWSQQAYLKSSQVSVGDNFGVSVAIYGDTVVVGAVNEDSGTAGVQNTAGPSVNESATESGAAYVFVRSGTVWSQQAYLKSSQVSASDQFGQSVALAGDTIVVGADYEDSGTAGVQNTAAPTVDESSQNAGAAYVYVRSGTMWSQQAYLKAPQVSVVDRFGLSVAVAGDTVVVGASEEDSGTAGVQNTAAPSVDEAAANAGAAYVFVRTGAQGPPAWSQQAYLKAPQVSAGDRFGVSVAVAGDTVVVGAVNEDSSTAGVQNTATPAVDESATNAGAAYVFVRSGAARRAPGAAAWSQQVYLKASQVSAGDVFGGSVAVAGDLAVVGAYWEDSGTAGVQSTAAPTVDEASADSGAAFVYAGAPGSSPGGLLYMPSLWSFNPRLLATLTGAAIPEQPVTVPGAAFYTATITLPNPLPSGGAFYLSGSPTSLTPGLVDDGLVMTAGGQEIFRHDYGEAGRPNPALVPVPRTALAPWAGQAVKVQFVDFHGSVTQASPLYLLWQP